MPSHPLPPARRIRRRGEFQHVFEVGRRAHGRFLTVVAAPATGGTSRLGIVASRFNGLIVESLIDGHRLDEAERELQRLASSGVAKVSIEGYRLRIADIAALAERDVKGQELEKRYRERIQVKDWNNAREVALEYEKLLPDSPRPAQLFNEISRYEEVHRKQQGIEQGVKQLEAFLTQKKRSEAELALKILLQMDPEHPRRSEFASRLAGLAR